MANTTKAREFAREQENARRIGAFWAAQNRRVNTKIIRGNLPYTETNQAFYGTRTGLVVTADPKAAGRDV